AANDIRDVHGYGARYSLWYGELNPATGLPWTPADIVNFDIGGNSVLKVRSQTATATHFPKLFAMRLVVWVAPETRKAVGVWRRPHTLATRLNNITTDALISVPDGSAGWSKEAGKNYVLCFRQSCAPALWGPVNADDVQWLGAYQDLTAAGQPPGRPPVPDGGGSAAWHLVPVAHRWPPPCAGHRSGVGPDRARPVRTPRAGVRREPTCRVLVRAGGRQRQPERGLAAVLHGP